MALERVFKRSATLKRVRRSRLWMALDGFGQWLFDHGRLPESVRIHLWHVRCLTTYLERHGIRRPSEVTREEIEGFLRRHLAAQQGRQGGPARHWWNAMCGWAFRGLFGLGRHPASASRAPSTCLPQTARRTSGLVEG